MNIQLVGLKGTAKKDLLSKICDGHDTYPDGKKVKKGDIFLGGNESNGGVAHLSSSQSTWRADGVDGAIFLMNRNDAEQQGSHPYQILEQIRRANIPFFIVLTEAFKNKPVRSCVSSKSGPDDVSDKLRLDSLKQKFVVNSSFMKVKPFLPEEQEWLWPPTDSTGHIEVPYTITKGTCYTEEMKDLLTKLMDILVNQHHQVESSQSQVAAQGSTAVKKKSFCNHDGGRSSTVKPGHVEMYELQSVENMAVQLQSQTQFSAVRSIQASTQMLFDVWKNCMCALEEFEQFELQRYGETLERSLKVVGVRRQSLEEARQLLTTQLIIFQTHMGYCRGSVVVENVPLLKEKTLLWTASRADADIKGTETDLYAGKIIEILMTGKTTHDFEAKAKRVDHRTRNDCVQKIFTIGMHQKSELDRQFRDNPEKKAQAHHTRRGSHLRSGAERICFRNPSLEPYLREELAEPTDESTDELMDFK